MSTGLNEYEVGDYEEMEAGRTPPDAGTYHLAVLAVNMEPIKKSGEAKNGIDVTFQVQAGTVDGQQGRSFTQTFGWPSPAHKDGGKFAAKVLGRLGAILGVARPGMKFGDVPWEEMTARHFVGAVHHESFEGDNGPVVSAKLGSESESGYVNPLAIWHVASPEVAAIPKDEEVLELMPMGADPFSGAKGGGGKGDDNGESGQPAKPAPTAPKSAPAKAPAAKTAARATKPAAAAPAPAAQTKAAGPYDDL